MYFENSVCQWIWKTTLNIHQLKNNKYKQSHKCSNNQQMDFLDPWLIVSSIFELSWPLILIWYPSSSWITLMVSPVWLSFLCPWTPFHLVHYHLTSFIQFEILFGKYFLVLHLFSKGLSIYDGLLMTSRWCHDCTNLVFFLFCWFLNVIKLFESLKCYEIFKANNTKKN